MYETDFLYPLESAIGRALKQAAEDRNVPGAMRLRRAEEALSKVRPLFQATSGELAEHNERFAREILLEIVDNHTGPITALQLVPFVTFVRSCA